MGIKAKMRRGREGREKIDGWDGRGTLRGGKNAHNYNIQTLRNGNLKPKVTNAERQRNSLFDHIWVNCQNREAIIMLFTIHKYRFRRSNGLYF